MPSQVAQRPLVYYKSRNKSNIIRQHSQLYPSKRLAIIRSTFKLQANLQHQVADKTNTINQKNAHVSLPQNQVRYHVLSILSIPCPYTYPYLFVPFFFLDESELKRHCFSSFQLAQHFPFHLVKFSRGFCCCTPSRPVYFCVHLPRPSPSLTHLHTTARLSLGQY